MWKTFLTVVIFLLAAVVLKNGKFPNIHVGRNPAMRKRHIGCVEEQDREAQKVNPMAVNEKVNN